MPEEELSSMMAYYKTNDKMETARKMKEAYEKGIYAGRYPNLEVYEFIDGYGTEMICVVRNADEKRSLFSSPYCNNIKKLL